MLRPHSPTVREGPTPYTGWAHLQGGQRSVSLEYQTCTSAYLFDTLVTGKPDGANKLLVSEDTQTAATNKEIRKQKKSDSLNLMKGCLITGLWILL